MSSGATFKAQKPIAQQPFEIIKTSDFGYTSSWKNAGNARKSSELKDVSSYLNNINKETEPKLKKAYKNIKKD